MKLIFTIWLFLFTILPSYGAEWTLEELRGEVHKTALMHRQLANQFNTLVFNCPSGFNSTITGLCGADFSGFINPVTFGVYGTSGGMNPSLVGSTINLLQSAGAHTHSALSFIYQTQVDVRKFQTTFQFTSGGYNVNLVFNNTNNQGIFNGNHFSGGAGCEGGFWQGFPGAGLPPPNNVFAVDFNSFDGTAAGTSTFLGSGVQYFWGQNANNAPSPPGQSPCNPDLGSNAVPFTYHGVDYILTSPVQLNSPSNSRLTTTGHTYQATFTYDGSNLDLLLFDVTGGGTCTPSSSGTCFHQTWTSVDIPTAVGSNAAWVGIFSANNLALAGDVNILNWTYFTP